VNKAALKRLALEVRREIGIDVLEALDPYALAREYGVEIVRLSDLDCSPGTIEHFTSIRKGVFSGALIPLGGGGAVIVENDSHAVERRISTAGHEMAHVLLEHPFDATITDSTGCRMGSRAHEEEAAELGAELLIPTDAAHQLAYRGVRDEEVAARFGVSLQLARWRLDATGARVRAARIRAKQGRMRRR